MVHMYPISGYTENFSLGSGWRCRSHDYRERGAKPAWSKVQSFSPSDYGVAFVDDVTHSINLGTSSTPAFESPCRVGGG